MHILIGGSGFIGTRLVRSLLNEGIRTHIIDKTSSSEYPALTTIADVRDFDSLLKTAVDGDVIINLAAEHRDNVQPTSLYNDVNVDGAINVCKFAIDRDIRTIIFTSSVAVYGFAERGTAEDGPINPFNAYGESKAKAEQIYIDWQNDDKAHRRLIIIRPTVVFGEGNRGNVYNLFKQINDRKFVMIGSGRNQKSMAYVENVAAFIKYATSLNIGIHTFNYVDKPDMSMEELVGKIESSLGYRSRIRLRLPKFIGLSVGILFDFVGMLLRKDFPISKIRIVKFCSDSVYASKVEDTNFVPPVILEEAIEKTLAHEFRDNIKQ